MLKDYTYFILGLKCATLLFGVLSYKLIILSKYNRLIKLLQLQIDNSIESYIILY